MSEPRYYVGKSEPKPAPAKIRDMGWDLTWEELREIPTTTEPNE